MERDFVHRLLYLMLLIRRFEERTLELLNRNMLASTMCHLSIGQEATAVGVCVAMREQDYVTGTHRGHGHLIARGGDLRRMMAELMGKATGYCKGRGGSMHMTDINIGHLGANGIVGGHIDIATGAALWSKISNSKAVTVCFFGDGAVTEGRFHEALNMAAVWQLPVVFVCENNQYAMSLPWEKASAQMEFAPRGGAYDIPGVDVDGQDPVAVYEVAQRAIERARKGGGPTLIGAHTYRFLGHSRSDPSPYREEKEEAAWRARDPILVFQDRFTQEGLLTEDEILAMEESVTDVLDDAVHFAERGPAVPLETALEDVYA